MKTFKIIAGLISLGIAAYAFSVCRGTSGLLLSAFLILYGVAAFVTRSGYIGGKIQTESYVLFFAWLASIALLVAFGREGNATYSDAALGAFMLNVAWTLACFTVVTRKGMKTGEIADAQKELAEKQKKCPRCGSTDAMIQFVETGSKAHTDAFGTMRGKIKGNKIKGSSQTRFDTRTRNKMKKVAICQNCGYSWKVWF